MKSEKYVIWGAGVVVVGLIITLFVRFVFDPEKVKLWGYSMTQKQAGDQITRLNFKTTAEKLVVMRTIDIDQQSAESIINEKVFLFASLFEPQRVGYKGQHTEFVECSDEFKPRLDRKSIAGGEIQYFSGFANERFVPGACDQESAVFQFITAYLYCTASETLYDIERFIDRNSAQQAQIFIDKIQCDL